MANNLNAIGAAIPIALADGGTNATTMATTDGVVYYDGTRLVTTAVGTATNVLTSNGAGMAPTFQAAGGGNPAASCNFLAYLSAQQNNVTGDGSTFYTVPFDTAIYNTGSNYNTANGIFTAPNSGIYAFYSTVNADNTGGVGASLSIAITATFGNLEGQGQGFVALVPNNFLSASVSGTIHMTAGDTCKIVILGNIGPSGGAKTMGVYGAAGPNYFTWFGGYQVA